MKIFKIKKYKGLFIGVGSALVIGGFFVVRYLLNRNKGKVAGTSTTIVGSGGSGAWTTIENVYNGGGNGNLYNPYSIQTAYLDEDDVTYLPYADLDEALDKNVEDSGFTNKTETIYASSMDTGNKAYQNVNGTILFPMGNYFYQTTFEMLVIDQQGVMHFYNDVNKDGLNAQIINFQHLP